MWILIPNWGNCAIGVSKMHSAPDVRLSPSPFSEFSQWASRTLTTNQPSLTGPSPEPESPSCASATRRF